MGNSGIEITPLPDPGPDAAFSQRLLRPDEQELLDDYNDMNEYGMEECRRRTKEMKQIEQYKKVPTAERNMAAG